jgi:ketosteroid isomerase-like protein
MTMDLKESFVETMRMSDSRDLEGFLAQLDQDIEWIAPGAELRGRDQAEQWLNPFWQAFSSFRHDFSRVAESDGTVYAEGTWSGVNDGVLPTPQGDLPATGANVSFRFAAVVTGEPGRIRTLHVYFDQLEFLGQLGVLPAPEGQEVGAP